MPTVCERHDELEDLTAGTVDYHNFLKRILPGIFGEGKSKMVPKGWSIINPSRLCYASNDTFVKQPEYVHLQER